MRLSKIKTVKKKYYKSKKIIMGFDDLFEQGHKHHKYEHDQHYGYDDYHQSSHSYNKHYDIKQLLLTKLSNNPKLKAFLIFAAIIVIVVVVIGVILLFPLLMKLFSYISENGIEGLINTIWKGTK